MTSTSSVQGWDGQRKGFSLTVPSLLKLRPKKDGKECELKGERSLG